MPIIFLYLPRPSDFGNFDNRLPLREPVEAKKAKVFRNNSDKTVEAERNYGLKGGEASAARPESAAVSAEFNGNLITKMAETPKQKT